jgi:hypothetical protein
MRGERGGDKASVASGGGGAVGRRAATLSAEAAVTLSAAAELSAAVPGRWLGKWPAGRRMSSW